MGTPRFEYHHPDFVLAAARLDKARLSRAHALLREALEIGFHNKQCPLSFSSDGPACDCDALELRIAAELEGK